MSNQNENEEEESMTALMNLNQVEELIGEYDSPNANPFELSRKLQELVIASDNKLALVRRKSEDQKQV